MLSKAIEIAAKAHSGQVDNGGNPYILHLLRVMFNCESEKAKICAVLHDVVRDTAVTMDELRSEGFSDEIIAALECLTKVDGESYEGFIDRVLSNETACWVKLADLADNMDLTRIGRPTAKDEERIIKYKQAAGRITDALPYADEIPDCHYLEINGYAQIHPIISNPQFVDMFIRFFESHGWFFGGDIKEMADKEAYG